MDPFPLFDPIINVVCRTSYWANVDYSFYEVMNASQKLQPQTTDKEDNDEKMIWYQLTSGFEGIQNHVYPWQEIWNWYLYFPTRIEMWIILYKQGLHTYLDQWWPILFKWSFLVFVLTSAVA